MSTRLIPLILCCALAPSCAAVAGVAGGIILGQEVLENDVIQITVAKPVDATWNEVKSFMSDRSTDLIDVDESIRVAEGRMNGAKVTIGVLAYDTRSTHIRVAAKSYGLNDTEATELTVSQLHDRLNVSSD